MNLQRYLNRINYTGDLTPTLATLTALHRAHLLAISYENLNIHLGRTLTLDQEDIYQKIVLQERGGWCFEMNGLFAWALRELGFEVTLLASAVNRAAQGAQAERNHLILLVQLEQPYLVDVGFGNGFLEPLPLQPGQYRQGIFEYQLAVDGERWQFTNHAWGGAGFDFTLAPRTLPDFAEQCHRLQTSPDSGFVRTVVCHRFTPDGMMSLRGAVLRTITPAGARDVEIADEQTYRQIISKRFDLPLSDADLATLWAIVERKHQEYLAAQQT
jgi:N-hydroxyarylamine O-acetyltransferase